MVQQEVIKMRLWCEQNVVEYRPHWVGRALSYQRLPRDSQNIKKTHTPIYIFLVVCRVIPLWPMQFLYLQYYMRTWYMHVDICIYGLIHNIIYRLIYISIHINIYKHICEYMWKYLNICILMYIFMCMLMYVFIYIHVSSCKC